MIKNISPPRLFLIDGLGALLSAGLLAFVLPLFEPPVGLPIYALRDLALGALLLSVYSLSCSRWLRSRYRYYLGTLATANLAYCAATGFMLQLYHKELTALAWFYFVGEITIIVLLAVWEFRVAFRNQ